MSSFQETVNGATTTEAAPDSLQMLWEIATCARRIHLVLLDRVIGVSETMGSCMFASAQLASLVNRFSAWRAQVRGGYWVAPSGQRHGHYWVHAQLHDVHFVLDITADQFGLSEVLVLPLASAQAWQVDESVSVDEHLAEEQLEVLLEKAPSVARGMSAAAARA